MSQTNLNQDKKNVKHFLCKKEDDLRIFIERIHQSFIQSLVHSESRYWQRVNITSEISESVDKSDDSRCFSILFSVIGVESHSILEEFKITFDETIDTFDRKEIVNKVSSVFTLFYNGILSKREDLEKHYTVLDLPIENNINIELSLSNTLNEVVDKVGDHSFEITYSTDFNEQRVLYIYNEEKHRSFLSQLLKRCSTHRVSLRLIENEGIEWFLIKKKLLEPNRIINKQLIGM